MGSVITIFCETRMMDRNDDSLHVWLKKFAG